MPGSVVSSFAALTSADVAVLSFAFLGVSNADFEALAVGPAGPARFGGFAAAGQAGPVGRAVGTEAIAVEVGLGWPGPEEVLVRLGAEKMVAEMVGMAEECHFPGADHRAVTAGWHFVHVCLGAAPMHVAGYVGLVVHCRLGRPGPGPVAPVVAAASRGIVVGVGNFAVGHVAFAAEDAPC